MATSASAASVRGVAGILLTGGRSSRLGIQKASLRTTGGETLATRTARLLRTVADPAVEVGPGISGLVAVLEDEARGPLGAVVAGLAALDEMTARRPTLVLATDLPRLGPDTIQALARFPGETSVVPAAGGVPQVLCARYSPAFLAAAVDAFAAGERSLLRLVDRLPGVEVVEAERWGDDGPASFDDVDTPDDLRVMVSLGVLAEPESG